jgi:transposase-like protein
VAGLVSLDELLKGRPFDPEVVVLCVRWHFRFKLRYRDLVG